MDGPDYKANNLFLKDAHFIFENEAWRRSFVARIRRLAGRNQRRSEAFAEIELFIDDFHLIPARRREELGSVALSKILRDIVHNDIRWPIAPLLAWLSFHHPGEAEDFYKACGLSARINCEYRAYVGVPGERAIARRTGGHSIMPLGYERRDTPGADSRVPPLEHLANRGHSYSNIAGSRETDATLGGAIASDIKMLAYIIAFGGHLPRLLAHVEQVVGSSKIHHVRLFMELKARGFLDVFNVSYEEGVPSHIAAASLFSDLSSGNNLEVTSSFLSLILADYPDTARSAVAGLGVLSDESCLAKARAVKGNSFMQYCREARARRNRELSKLLGKLKPDWSFELSNEAEELLKNIYDESLAGRPVPPSSVETPAAELFGHGLIDVDMFLLDDAIRRGSVSAFQLTTLGYLEYEQRGLWRDGGKSKAV